MERYTNFVVLRKNSIKFGNADEGAEVEVFLADGTTSSLVLTAGQLVKLYSDGIEWFSLL